MRMKSFRVKAWIWRIHLEPSCETTGLAKHKVKVRQSSFSGGATVGPRRGRWGEDRLKLWGQADLGMSPALVTLGGLASSCYTMNRVGSRRDPHKVPITTFYKLRREGGTGRSTVRGLEVSLDTAGSLSLEAGRLQAPGIRSNTLLYPTYPLPS